MNEFYMIIIGCLLSLFAIVGRAFTLKERLIDINELPNSYWVFFVISLIGPIFGFVGFYKLLMVNGTQDDGIAVLTILAMLSAGAIAGFYAFSYQEAHPQERFLPTFLSCAFTVIFYFLFSATSYFLGKEKMQAGTQAKALSVSGVMLLLLIAAAAFDFFDAVELDPETKKKQTLNCK